MPWVSVGNVRGPAGAQGPQGPQGEQGPPGDPVDLDAHINAPTPHKAYDVDLPSLQILFENGLS